MDDKLKQDGEVEQPIPETTPLPTPGAVISSESVSNESTEAPDVPPALVTPEAPQVVAPEVVPEVAPVVSPVVESTPEPKRSRIRPELLFIPPLRRRLGKNARPLAWGLIVIVLLAAGGGVAHWKLTKNTSSHIDASSFALPVTPFKLESTSPADGAKGVDTATSLTLNFNKPVDPSKLVNNLFVTPNTAGTYKAGSNPDQAIFVPNKPFAQGTKITVMLNPTYQNKQGSKLGIAKLFGFTTVLAGNGVDFQDQNGLYDQVTSLPSGQKETYKVELGDSVGAGASVTLYKGTVSELVNSLTYTTDQYNIKTLSDNPIPTSSLSQISSQSNITNDASYVVQQPDGLYVAVATNAAGKQLGFVWVDVSNFGVLLKQDDQKVIVDAQSYSDASDVPADMSFYNLAGSERLLSQQTVDGLATINLPVSPSIDLATATYNGETAVIPVNVPDSGGDVRVDQNLSTAQQVYGVTDKPSYTAGDTIQLAGFARLDNDAQYVNPGSGTVSLYVAHYKGDSPLYSFNATIGSDGMLKADIPSSASWLTSGDAFDQLQIFASAVDGNSTNDIPVSSFTLTNQANAGGRIQVAFGKAEYTPNQPITATITATDRQGQPLANKTVQVHLFSQDYYENDAVSDLEEFGSAGSELPASPVTVTLNASGQATYTVKPASLPNDGSSQAVTLQVNLPGTQGVGAAGGDSTIVHQGDGFISLGLGRQTIPTGQSLSTEAYVKHLNGDPYAAASVKYQLIDTSSNASLASGITTTDSTGVATISIPASQLASNGDGMELQLSTLDTAGNSIQGSGYFSVSSSTQYDTSGTGLQDLNISGSASAVQAGDTVNLTITAPAKINALVTMDRGRLYEPKEVTLNSGSNQFSFTVGADLAPSFTLTFSYFLNGVYHSEGVAFTVSDPAQQASVALTPTAQTVPANKPTTVTVAIQDKQANPLSAHVIVDVVSSNAYDLTSPVAPNIFETLFNARPIMTTSSSSLSPVGSGGGRCGGGGANLPSDASALGTTLLWQPDVATNSSGQATVTFTPPAGDWTVSAYAVTNNTQVGSAITHITAK
jgi:uncharacterized protein YfaS (alpha-2-macroglobulin family)